MPENCGRNPHDADARTVLAALTIEKLHPDVTSCAELSSSESEPHLRLGGINQVVLSGELSRSLMAQAAIDAGQARIFQNLLHPSQGSRIQTVRIPTDWLGQAFGKILERAQAELGVIPIAIKTREGEIHINPGQHILQEGEVVFAIEGDSIC